MAKSCTVCSHPKRDAIDAAIAHGRRLGVIAAQYRLVKADVIKHVAHRVPASACVDAVSEATTVRERAPSQARRESGQAIGTPIAPDMTDPSTLDTSWPLDTSIEGLSPDDPWPFRPPVTPFDRFKQAWREAADDPRQRERMVAWLNEQLQAVEESW